MTPDHLLLISPPYGGASGRCYGGSHLACDLLSTVDGGPLVLSGASTLTSVSVSTK
jgi:hypothetical protein